MCGVFFFFKQKTAYEMRIRDWSSDVCSSDLAVPGFQSLGRLLVGDDIVDPGADLVALTKVGKLGEARRFLGRDRRRILRHPGRHHVAEEVGPAVMHQVDLGALPRYEPIEIVHPLALPSGLDRQSTRLNSSH